MISIVPNLEQNYSPMLKVLKFETCDVFFIFGMLNVKYLVFDTPNTSARGSLELLQD